MPRRATLLLVIVAAFSGGCTDPYGQSAEAPPGMRPGPGELDGEIRGGTVPDELQPGEPSTFPEAGETPRATLELAGELHANWTSATVVSHLKRMAAMAVGEARAQLHHGAANAGLDRTSQLESVGRVVAVDVAGAGQRRQAVVVTRERVTGAGLTGSRDEYRVTLATVERRGDQWVLARWLPQP